ncbi:MAG: hypothetical protein MOB07_04905 [Acidobacteria bacterium]|nr:hypothetical protein [Acidobacteriota bacterium]
MAEQFAYQFADVLCAVFVVLGTLYLVLVALKMLPFVDKEASTIAGMD